MAIPGFSVFRAVLRISISKEGQSLKLLKVSAAILGITLFAAAPALAAPGVLLDFNGFDYTFPVPGGDFAAATSPR